MIILYQSRSNSGTTRGFAEKLGRSLGLRVYNLMDIDTVDKEYILCTFTDGVGEVPRGTKKFLSREGNAEKMIGVIANGSSNFKSTGLYGLAGDRISNKYGVELIKKLDMGGGIEDVYEVAQRINYKHKLGIKLDKKSFKPGSTFKNGRFNFKQRNITTESNNKIAR